MQLTASCQSLRLKSDPNSVSEILKDRKRCSRYSQFGQLLHGRRELSVWETRVARVGTCQKNVAAPRVKRAAAVYIAGNLAVVLYGSSASEITFKPTGLDPIFDSMDRGTLMLLSTHLKFTKSRS